MSCSGLPLSAGCEGPSSLIVMDWNRLSKDALPIVLSGDIRAGKPATFQPSPIPARIMEIRLPSSESGKKMASWRSCFSSIQWSAPDEQRPARSNHRVGGSEHQFELAGTGPILQPHAGGIEAVGPRPPVPTTRTR